MTRTNYGFYIFKFFFLAGKNVKDTRMTWTSNQVKLRSKLVAKFLTPKPSCSTTAAPPESPFGIILLKAKPKFDLSGIKIDGIYLSVTSGIERIVRNCVVDMVVYGGNTDAVKCNIFDQLVPELASKDRYIVKEFRATSIGHSSNIASTSTATATNVDKSLSRCTESLDPFIPEVFNL